MEELRADLTICYMVFMVVFVEPFFVVLVAFVASLGV